MKNKSDKYKRPETPKERELKACMVAGREALLRLSRAKDDLERRLRAETERADDAYYGHLPTARVRWAGRWGDLDRHAEGTVVGRAAKTVYVLVGHSVLGFRERHWGGDWYQYPSPGRGE